MAAARSNAETVADRRKRHCVSLAARQWGVLRRSDLNTVGIDDAAIARWVASHRLHRLHRGVYCFAPPTTLTPQGHDLAAVYACGEAAILCAVSAAVRWGMLRHGPRTPQVLVGGTGRRRKRGISLRVTGDLPPTDSTFHERIPITTVERTILDLAATSGISTRALESAAAQAERDGRFSRAVQLRTAGRSRDRTGAARLRSILRVGPRLWRSDEEQLASIALVDAGLPEPVIAYEASTDIGTLEVDLSYPDARLIIEVDGGQHDLTLNAARDVDRDAALARAGWRTVRIPARVAREQPDEVVRRVRQAMA